MTDESVHPEQDGGSSPTPRQKLDKGARNRVEAARLIAAAEKFEADKARTAKEGLLRDQRILGGVVMELAENATDLARLLIEGVGSCSVSKFDRKHLEREGSALALLHGIVVKAAKAKEPSTETGAWFAVPYPRRDEVPAGVIFDPATKCRYAPTATLIAEMRRLGFEERSDLENHPPPARN